VASGANSYTWNPGGNTPTVILTPTVSNTYTVTGVNANGCLNTATALVNVSSLPNVTASVNPTLVCTGRPATLTASGASSYVWSTGVGASIISVTPFSNSTYTVSGTDANGCTSVYIVTVTVQECVTTGTEQNEGEFNAISFYPNPGTGELKILNPGNETFRLKVYNHLGQLVYDTTTPDTGSVDLKSLSKGIYTVVLLKENKTVKQAKIILQQE
jgi:hypothetical protein